MDVFFLAILIIAGVLAGIITGLAGASAVMVMAPLLIIFLKMDAYVAIGLSLATDVFASLVAFRIYNKNKNIVLKPTIPVLIFAFLGIVMGSYISLSFSTRFLSIATGMGIFLIGGGFILRKSPQKRKTPNIIKKIKENKKLRIIILSLAGLIIGLIGGVFGAGGGIMLLATFVFILNYKMHKAIGTSILIMIFIAFLASITHYYYKPFSIIYLCLACFGGFIGANYSSKIANLTSEKKLKKIVGSLFLVLGFLLSLNSFLGF